MTMRPAYQPHESLVSWARLAPDLPRLLIGMVAIEMLYGLGLNLISALLASAPSAAQLAFQQGTTRIGLLMQLFSFGLLSVAVILVAKLLHHRPPGTLIGPKARTTNHLLLALAAGLGLFLALELLPPYWSVDGTRSSGFGLWLGLLPLSLLALFVQTSAEELLYRGYFQQQLAARFSAPWVWLVVPNVFFALAHWNKAGAPIEAAQYVTWAFFFGLAASDLTARTGSLGAAIGFHMANNVYAFLFFAERATPDSGLALFLLPPPDSSAAPSPPPSGLVTLDLLLELTVLGLMWLAVRVAVRR